MSGPWSYVSERRRWAGSVRSSRAKACRTVTASFAVSGTSHVNRVVRSTSVPSADAWAWPTSTSPSQCPGTVRSATSSGRSSMLIRSWMGRDVSRTLRGRRHRCRRRRARTSSRLNAPRGSTES